MTTLKIIFGIPAVLGIIAILYFVFVNKEDIFDVEQIKKQRNNLLIGIIIFFVIAIISAIENSITAYMTTVDVVGVSIGLIMILVNFWLLCYGIRHIYYLIKLKTFGISYFVILLVWILVLVLIFNAFYIKFKSIGLI